MKIPFIILATYFRYVIKLKFIYLATDQTSSIRYFKANAELL